MSRLRIAILGSTGSIGRQALEVAEANRDRIEVVALAANRNAELLVEQVHAHDVRLLALAETDAAIEASRLLPETEVGEGADAVEALAAEPGVDLVLNALVGAAGLRATVTALESRKTLALANKESLVVGGEFVTALAKPGQLIPVDSEHSAVHQCLVGESPAEVARIWLTASGGPFRGRTREELADVTADEALAHPTWEMGPKITIDSATLMNKGLEAIEARHLFGVDYDRISIVVHPQSCVHSMVEFADGSVKAHLGATDMRIPIQYAFSHPARWDTPVPPVDFATIGSLDFEPPDLETFRVLALALDAGRTGGTMPAAMNAANEVAVAAFLAGRIRFTDIDETVARVMSEHDPAPIESLEHIELVDVWARDAAERAVHALG